MFPRDSMDSWYAMYALNYVVIPMFTSGILRLAALLYPVLLTGKAAGCAPWTGRKVKFLYFQPTPPTGITIARLCCFLRSLLRRTHLPVASNSFVDQRFGSCHPCPIDRLLPNSHVFAGAFGSISLELT